MGWRLSFSSLHSDWPWAPFSIQSNWLLWVLSPSEMWLHHWADLAAVVFFVEYRDQNSWTHAFMAWHLTKDRKTLSMRNTVLGLQFDPVWAGFLRNVTALLYLLGTAVAQWLRCCATNWKVASSIPASVNGFFIDIKSFQSHYGPGVDSASNRNEYQEHFLGVKAADA